MNRTIRLLGAGLAVLLIGACASAPRTVPFNVHSDPQGAYVLLQVQPPVGPAADWVFIGNTPLNSVREMDLDTAKKAKTVTLRVMKEGYFDQTKVWVGDVFVGEAKDKGKIFWTPRMVRAGD